MTQKIKCDCGADCDFTKTDPRPCWGEVHAIDEIETGDGYEWVHACEGHAGVYDGIGYEEEQKEV